jgi:hypothetical protein
MAGPLFAVEDHVVHFAEDPFGMGWTGEVRALGKASKKAGSLARMTGRSDLVRQDQQGVSIAIEPDFAHVLNVAGGFPFLPQLSARAAPEMDEPGLKGFGEGLAIHIRQREHLSSRGVLDDGRDEAVLIEV